MIQTMTRAFRDIKSPLMMKAMKRRITATVAIYPNSSPMIENKSVCLSGTNPSFGGHYPIPIRQARQRPARALPDTPDSRSPPWWLPVEPTEEAGTPRTCGHASALKPAARTAGGITKSRVPAGIGLNNRSPPPSGRSAAIRFDEQSARSQRWPARMKSKRV